MKINEVESLVGITKKNIRFYESEGLLLPPRSENGYRNYGDAEVAVLRQIKLLRKLGLPLQEIRAMQDGLLTVPDAMRRHQVTLEREQKNLSESLRLCEQLKTAPDRLTDLDAAALLDAMTEMERSGASFQNRQEQDIRIRYVAPVTVTVLVTLFMLLLSALLLWLLMQETMPSPVILSLCLILVLLPLMVIIGILMALRQRITEIGRRELDDARRF